MTKKNVTHLLGKFRVYLVILFLLHASGWFLAGKMWKILIKLTNRREQENLDETLENVRKI